MENNVRSFRLVALIFFLFLFQKISGNPIPTPVMNEVKIGSNNFTLEIINNGMFATLDGCFLSTTTSTAYFKSGIPGDIDYLLITQDSLLTPLSLNPSGDMLSFHGPGMEYVETIIFGDSTNCTITAPMPLQSICLDIYNGFYYLDKTPTLGAPNDYLNATGILEGYVTNLAGDTLQNVRISRKFGSPIYTNSSGYFSIEEPAILEELVFHKTPYPDGYLRQQIWPDSVQTIHVVIESLVNIDKMQYSQLASDFQLFQNYPNPFNSGTTLEFYLPYSDIVELNIFDMLGRKIKSMLGADCTGGWYRLFWDGKDDRGNDVASGIYIYRLTADNRVINRKMLLLR